MKDKKRTAAIIAAVILGCAALLYLGGMLGQLLKNYSIWLASDGINGQSTMEPVSWNPLICFPMAFSPQGLKGMLGILFIGGGIVAYVKLHDKFDGKPANKKSSPKEDLGKENFAGSRQVGRAAQKSHHGVLA